MRRQLLATDWLEMHEVETQAIRGHERSRLFDVAAEDLAQRRVEQVRRGVVAASGVAHGRVHFRCHDVPRTQHPGGHADTMRARKAWLHPDEAFDRGQRASGFIHEASGVGHLTAGLEVERRARQCHVAGGPRRQGVDRPPFLVEQRHDRDPCDAGARVAFELISGALQRAVILDAEIGRPFLAPERALASRAAALRGHGGLVAGLIHLHALSGCGVFNEFVGDAERVIEAERGFAGEHTVGRFERLRDLRLPAAAALR